MKLNKKELAKLSPEERIKKLKQLEEARKKEATEIEGLIKEYMQELKTKKIADSIAPEQKAVDISKLFEAPKEEKLERTARQEAPPVSRMKGSPNYNIVAQAYEDYNKLKNLYGIIGTGGTLDEHQLQMIGQIGERMNTVEKYMTESEKSASKLIASRAVLYKLKKETGLE